MITYFIVALALLGVGLFAIDRGIDIERDQHKAAGVTMRLVGIIYVWISIVMLVLKINELLWKPW